MYFPNPEISLQTDLDAVNRQSQDTEAGNCRLKRKSDYQYKWRSAGNKNQYNGNNENLKDLFEALWALDNSKTNYARDLINVSIDRHKHRSKLIKIADSSDGGWDVRPVQ